MVRALSYAAPGILKHVLVDSGVRAGARRVITAQDKPDIKPVSDELCAFVCFSTPAHGLLLLRRNSHVPATCVYDVGDVMYDMLGESELLFKSLAML